MYRKGEEGDILPVDKPGSGLASHHLAPTPNVELYWNVKCFLLHHIFFPLFSKIWRTRPRQLLRQKPLEVLVLGPSHCGTDALSAALEVLGYDEPHQIQSSLAAGTADDAATWSRLVAWKLACRLPGQVYAPMIPGCAAELRRAFEPVLASSSVVTGQAAAVFGPELLRAYPDARVILNRASGGAEAWVDAMRQEVESCQGWWASVGGLSGPGRFWRRQLWELLFLAQFYGTGDWGRRRWYVQHFGQMRALVKAGQCLEWCEADGWEPLCHFLGKPIPGVRFPGAGDQQDGVGGNSCSNPLLGYARSVFMALAVMLVMCLAGLVVGITAAGSGSRLYDYSYYGYFLGMDGHWCQQKLAI